MFQRTLLREFGLCLIVGAPMLGYVLATNRTASLGLILLHGALLGLLVPLLVSLLEWLVPSRSPLQAVGLRLLGLLLATVAMVLALLLLTPLSLDVLVGAPLFLALVPIYLAYALAGLWLQWAAVRERSLQAEAAEARARQEALAARIRPHFLFNALNCIEELTLIDPAVAREAVGRLSRLLRAVLQSSARPMGTLRDEVRRVEDYWEIERLRFGERFRVELVCPEALAERELPSTVLLTLAENAVKHGVETVRGEAWVRLEVEAMGAGLRVVMVGTTAVGTTAEGTTDAARIPNVTSAPRVEVARPNLTPALRVGTADPNLTPALRVGPSPIGEGRV